MSKNWRVEHDDVYPEAELPSKETYAEELDDETEVESIDSDELEDLLDDGKNDNSLEIGEDNDNSISVPSVGNEVGEEDGDSVNCRVNEV